MAFSLLDTAPAAALYTLGILVPLVCLPFLLVGSGSPLIPLFNVGSPLLKPPSCISPTKRLPRAPYR